MRHSRYASGKISIKILKKDMRQTRKLMFPFITLAKDQFLRGKAMDVIAEL